MTTGPAEDEETGDNSGGPKSDVDFKKLLNSPLSAGLPMISGELFYFNFIERRKQSEPHEIFLDDSMQKITMHYSGISLSLTEFVPAAHRIVDMFESAKFCTNQMQRQLEYISPKEKSGWIGALECITWKNMNVKSQTLHREEKA
jgi:hypothetical protein